MRLNKLWILYEKDNSQHALKAYFLQLKMLMREIENLEFEEVCGAALVLRGMDD